MHPLQSWGYSVFQAQLAPSVDAAVLGRVIDAQRDTLRVATAAGVIAAKLSGKLLHAAADAAALPVVGDYVVLRAPPSRPEELGSVERVLPRRGVLSRKAPGREVVEQVIAANVDGVLVVSSLNLDLNDRRLERYLAAVRAGGAEPVVVLTKADLTPTREAAAIVAHVAADIAHAPVVAVSVVLGLGLDELRALLLPGHTYCLVGSSGVGKSTLTNCLLGVERQETGAIGDGFDKGRHTTTARRMFQLPGGALLIDTPGMRELMPWDAEDGADDSFPELTALAAACRYGDCGHGVEPGCAVQEAIARGELDAGRLESYRKLQREQAFLERKTDARAAAAEKQRWKGIAKALRQRPRLKS